MAKSKRERPAVRQRARTKRQYPVGLPPGTLHIDPASPKPAVQFFGFGPDVLEEGTVAAPEDLVTLRGRWPVLWVNVVGLGDADVLEAMGTAFGLHKLAIEDVVNTHQRPKVERYPEAIFVVLRLLRWIDPGIELHNEQLSLFLGPDFVLTFQEYEADPFEPIRVRLREGRPTLRSGGADYMAYVLLDAVVDSYFPLLESFGNFIEDLEEKVDIRPTPDVLRSVRQARRSGAALRRAIWPTREALNTLQIDRLQYITDDTRVYLRDLYDHILRVLDIVESHRDEVSSLLEAYLSAASFRMNEVMNVLTVMGSIFLPLSFLTGLYGMNFDQSSPYNMPELTMRYGYPVLLAFMGLITVVLLGFFWRRGWLLSRALEDG